MLKSRIRVAVADDSALLRALIAHQINNESDMEVVGEAANGKAAVELAETVVPHVFLMDLDMPILTGVQATEQILSRSRETKVILLTSHENLSSLGKQVGAAECLLKSCSPADLVETIRRVHDSPILTEEKTTSGRYFHRLAQRFGLTDRERSVIELMVNTELTARQIATILSERAQTTISEAGVKHALERSLIKLQVEPHTRVALVRFIFLEQQALLAKSEEVA